MGHHLVYGPPFQYVCRSRSGGTCWSQCRWVAWGPINSSMLRAVSKAPNINIVIRMPTRWMNEQHCNQHLHWQPHVIRIYKNQESSNAANQVCRWKTCCLFYMFQIIQWAPHMISYPKLTLGKPMAKTDQKMINEFMAFPQLFVCVQQGNQPTISYIRRWKWIKIGNVRVKAWLWLWFPPVA